jgi:hypothetical protein
MQHANITSPEQLVTGISVSDTTDSLTPLFAFSKYNFFKLPRFNGIEMSNKILRNKKYLVMRIKIIIR